MKMKNSSIPNCLVALGSNLGDRAETIISALEAINALPLTHVMRRSSVIETAPVGVDESHPNYLNAVAEVSTGFSPHAFLGALLGIEAALGRRRDECNKNRAERVLPRTIDLDLLIYEGYSCDTPELILPHPRMHERSFVLRPLAELYPEGIALGYIININS